MRRDPAETRRLLNANLATYGRRLEGAVRVLGKTAHDNPDRALERFRFCRQRLEEAAAPIPEPPRAAAPSPAYDEITASLPTLFQLVLKLGARKAQGYAFLSQGRPGTSLPESVRALLAGTLKIYLESGGAPAQAKQLVDVVGLACPNLGALSEFSPLALALLMGFVPREQGFGLKAYLNTRLLKPRGFRDSMAQILRALSLEQPGRLERFFTHLYTEDAHLYGLGFDLGGQSPRAKLYLHVPQESLTELPARLRQFEGEACDHRQADEQTEAFSRFLSRFPKDACQERVELAIALTAGAPQYKYTVFFTGNARSAQEALIASLRGIGYPIEGLGKTLSELQDGVEAGVVFEHALNAVAMEQAQDGEPRLNIYMDAVV